VVLYRIVVACWIRAPTLGCRLTRNRLSWLLMVRICRQSRGEQRSRDLGRNSSRFHPSIEQHPKPQTPPPIFITKPHSFQPESLPSSTEKFPHPLRFHT